MGGTLTQFDAGVHSPLAALDAQLEANTSFRETLKRLDVSAGIADDDRLDVDDVRRVLPLLNPGRVQEQYDTVCRYSQPGTRVPSCLVGTIVALLAPAYFNKIANDASSVAALPGIFNIFTTRAVDLLQSMQRHADGTDVTSAAQKPWGEAIVAGTLEQAERAEEQ